MRGPAIAILSTLLLGIASLPEPFPARAQTPIKVPRVGFMAGGAPGQTTPSIDAFRQGLRELGYAEERTVSIEFRYAEGRIERFSDLAAELVRAGVDVIVAPGTVAAKAARKATTTVPIVLVLAGNPVEDGLIASFARPGGNVTGLTMSADQELGGKYLELLRETVPPIRRVGVLSNPLTPPHAVMLRQMETAARTMGLTLQSLLARRPEEIDRAFAAMARTHTEGLVVLADPMLSAARTRIAELAMKHRLPAIYGEPVHVAAGGLMAYGPDTTDLFRRAALYVDRILKGAKPADLPVERPTKFGLFVNLQTATAMGLTVPSSVLARADTVIR
jgi:putative tryptophan/tyrosine transport system substrate-binding protein